MREFPCSYKICATCTKWTGDRQVNSLVGRVKIENYNQRSQCTDSDRRGMNIAASGTCHNWNGYR